MGTRYPTPTLTSCEVQLQGITCPYLEMAHSTRTFPSVGVAIRIAVLGLPPTPLAMMVVPGTGVVSVYFGCFLMEIGSDILIEIETLFCLHMQPRCGPMTDPICPFIHFIHNHYLDVFTDSAFFGQHTRPFASLYGSRMTSIQPTTFGMLRTIRQGFTSPYIAVLNKG